MPKKTRASRQQQARRRPAPRPAPGPGAPTAVPPPGVGVADAGAEADASGAAGASPAADTAGATPAARTGTLPATSRRVARVDPAVGRRLRPQQKQVSTFPPLDADDPAIPFDRVPYVPADLRRVAVIAGIMVLLIVVAAVVVTHTVG